MARSISVQFTGDVSRLLAAFAAAGSAGKAFGRTMDARMMGAGRTMTRGLTLPVVAGFGYAAKAAGEFEAELNTFQAVSSATARQMEQVSRASKQLGADAKLPGTSAADAAIAMSELAKGGLSVKESMEAVRGTLQLAAAAQTDNATAATIVADTLNAFGLAGRDAGKVVDLLAASANASTASIDDMAQGLKQSSAVAKQAGVPVDQVTAALARLANAGIKGSDAGTSLKTMLMRLMAPAGAGAKKIKELGLELRDQQGNLKPLPALADEFTSKLKQMTPAQRDAALAAIFGSDAIRAANVLLTKGGAAQEEMRKKVTKQGAAQDLAAAKMKGFNGASEAFTSTIQTLAITLGGMLLPTMTSVLRGFTTLAAAVDGLPGPLRGLVIGVLMAVAAAGPMLIVIGKLVAAASALKAGIQAVGTAMAFVASPVGLFLAVAGGLAVAMAMLTSKSATASSAMGELKKAADMARDAVLGFRDALLGQNDAQTTFRQATLDHADALERYADVQRRVRSGEITGAAAKRELAAAELAVQRSENGVARARVGIIRANKDAATSVKELTARHNEERDAASKAVQLARTAAQVTPSPSSINARAAAEKALTDTLNRQAAELKPLIAETAKAGRANTTAGKQARDMNAALRAQRDDIARAREQMAPTSKAANAVGTAGRNGAGGIRALNNAAKATPGVMATAASGARSAGAAISQGLINGILSKIGDIRAASARVAREAEAAQRAEAMIKSPSVKFRRLGQWMGAGTAKGLEDSIPSVRTAGASVAREAATSTADGLKSSGGKVDANAKELAERTKKALTSQITAQKQSIRTAYERVASAAMKAFDDRTNELAAGRQSTFDTRAAGIDQARSALTPAEAEIQRVEDARAAARLVQGLADAERDLAAAQAEGDATAIVQAQRAVDDARLEQQLAGLKERAAAERAAQDAVAEERRTALQEEFDTSNRHFDAMRQIQRDSLEAALENEKNKLLRGKTQQEQAQKEIIAMLATYGVDYTSAGLRLGEAFAKGLEDSVDAATKAANGLAETVLGAGKINRDIKKKKKISDLRLAKLLAGNLPDLAAFSGSADGIGTLPAMPGPAPAGGRGGSATLNVTVVDRTVAGMSREQARRLADDIAPELARRVTFAV